MAGELIGKEESSLLFFKYGRRWRECRRLMHLWMSKQAAPAFWPVQEIGSYRLMESLLLEPEKFDEHLRT